MERTHLTVPVVVTLRAHGGLTAEASRCAYGEFARPEAGRWKPAAELLASPWPMTLMN